MPDKTRLLARIENAASIVTPYWPLDRFIAANPLQGLEGLPFETAVAQGAALFGGRGWPMRGMVARAYAEGRIDPDVLAEVAAAHGRADAPQPPVAEADTKTAAEAPPPSPADRVLIKWLVAFVDEGQAGWPMPDRHLGFYRAWKRIARFDPEIPEAGVIAALPDDPVDALLGLLSPVADEAREGVLTAQLAALPGWAGYIRWRGQEAGHPSARTAPITLADYLAVRLVLVRQFGGELRPAADPAPEDVAPDWPDAAIWLEAWEETWRRGLAERLSRPPQPGPGVPEAQLVFCIDVRSEVLRRHVEAVGPYETLGFAGFFGLAAAVEPYGAGGGYASCPVLLSPKFRVPEAPPAGGEADGARHLAARRRLAGLRGLVAALKGNVAGAFAFVEASGAVFGAAMVGRTLAPGAFGRALAAARGRVVPEVALVPQVALETCTGAGHGHGHADDHAHADDHGHGHVPAGLSEGERAEVAEVSLRIMGLTSGFAPLVVLTGHGGATVNNPFAAGLDCGACGGHRGGPNARAMAAILNDPAVRARLAARGLPIPAETLFLAAEHNTTTDAVTVFEPAEGIGSAAGSLVRLRRDLAAAQAAAAAERARRLPGAGADLDGAAAVAAVETRAADWAQVRPEWALARNAGFIVGHRSLTREIDLDGRCFLHSYDWRADEDGTFLEVILTAPMVVAEWINTQYFFSTVDNAVYGAGSKITHTVVGGVGVMQGNGSDLMTGLPLQSVMSADGTPYHEPLRLMTVVQAPVDRIEDVIGRNDILQTLFGNGWVALMAVDPETGRQLRRDRSGQWRPIGVTRPAAAQMSAVTADGTEGTAELGRVMEEATA